jgi:hypothetical protein
MKGNWKEFIKEKHLFKTTYCLTCKQKKVCGQLDSEYCCFCYYENEQEKNKEYSSYEKTLVIRGKEHQENFQQLQLLQNYQGCQHCKSREVDAYFLYEEKKLTCQPCRMRKEGSSSSPISFS